MAGNRIVRWNPVRELANMQSMMDRLFDEWRPLNDEMMRAGTNPLALDVHEDDKSYVITTELPGVKGDDIKIQHDGDFLSIEAEIPEQTFENEGKHAVMRERRYGSYSRRIRLPQTINFDEADAQYEDGVLKLTLPKQPEAQPRTISVKSNKHNGGQQS